ncbi:hypothetical protein MPH_01871 [Macrophomina phaseolina MS6]|uniref:Uncharacterized protein n=1 Tax=Macrophomina phaseolina (strain MS6) TaxID=1126212 RepID=K2S7F2_MACPH|nr:hypothetical protein MPH_01871 [Macrophomina phaseolina MS6]
MPCPMFSSCRSRPIRSKMLKFSPMVVRITGPHAAWTTLILQRPDNFTALDLEAEAYVRLFRGPPHGLFPTQVGCSTSPAVGILAAATVPDSGRGHTERYEIHWVTGSRQATRAIPGGTTAPPVFPASRLPENGLQGPCRRDLAIMTSRSTRCLGQF